MLGFSSKTQVNRPFKLSDLLKMLQADKTVKENAKLIRSITLANVINSQTTAFIDDGKVKEIYIFEISLKEKEIPKEFIGAFDKFIELHTLFIFECNEEYTCYGALKSKGEKGIKTGKYYQTDWSKQAPKIEIPLSANSLDDIYTVLVDELIPIEANEEESVDDFVARYDEITRLKKEITKKQKQVDNEKQPKRRFELNAELKELKKQLNNLQG